MGRFPDRRPARGHAPAVLGKKEKTPRPQEALVEKAFRFFSRFCVLRAEYGVLGAARLTFRDAGRDAVAVYGEINLFFPGSAVTLREELGVCPRKDIPAAIEALRLRLTETFPGAEVDVGPRRVFIRWSEV